MNFCTKCGNKNSEESLFCAKCGTSVQMQDGTQTEQSFEYRSQNITNQPPKPENNLVWAVLCTVLCCMPLGIVAIVYSTKVDSAYAEGRQEDAKDYANKAKNWAIAGALSSTIIMVIYVIFMLAVGVGTAL
ncbi:MAG: CD225/dispanin family protein [Crocinitomicaceae bacterium]|nr:CD225/dispanin family protein [Crocinitomicaceae bacterium]